ncbi:uncharacterized protein LOC127863412 [Dreissena polymorpha]|uniref:uncharacterized protein LOC127863412 n=1 Tax=Dreissena polymorpha TaxID=45954 RepID=UPI0022642863|nr:uncharacterized protein LOC127863412 [Dreissena polymorpha]
MTLTWVKLYAVGGFLVLQALAQTPTTTPRPPADIYCYVCDSKVVGSVCNDPYSKKELTPVKCPSRTCFKNKITQKDGLNEKGITRGCSLTPFYKAICENKMGTSSEIGSTCHCITDRCNAGGIPSLNTLAKITTFTMTVIMFLSISTFGFV